MAGTGGQGMPESVHQKSAVGQAGQGVREGQTLDLTLSFLALGEVSHKGHYAHDGTILVKQVGGTEFARDIVSIAMPQRNFVNPRLPVRNDARLLLKNLAVLLIREFHRVTSKQVFARVAEQVAHLLVHLRGSSVRADHPYPLR